MLKKVFVFSFVFMIGLKAIDPFSHIKITSNKATCQKCKDRPHTFIFNYLENVNVVLADGSIITADSLEIVFDSKGAKVLDNSRHKKQHAQNGEKSNNLSNIKQIIFKNNVHISNQNRCAQADSATVNILENTCKLDGNVKIKQTKVAQKDIPVDVQSTQALINLKTYEVTLLGSSQDPVSTVIELNKNIMSCPEQPKK
jgi:lipopolysaccharide export system protein LptA